MDNDFVKLLAFMLVGAGILVFARWASRFRDGSSESIHSYEPTPALVRPPSPNPMADPDSVLASFPPEPSLGPIRIEKFFFKKFDLVPGPPDIDVFADELLVRVYNAETDHQWWLSYYVASPKGLSQVLKETSWKYIYASEILIFPRYVLDEIRRAVIARIVADTEFAKQEQGMEEEESI